jgi:hypothetical protein
MRLANQIFSLLALFSIVTPSAATDVQALKAECAELGFKMSSKENADCAFKLLKRARDLEQTQSANDAARQAVEAQQRQFEYQQAQQLELQRRAVAAQEQAAKAQQQATRNQLFDSTAQMLMGTGAYYKPPAAAPRMPITCTTMGSFTNCQ